jgi:hypothetical protein
MNHFRLKASAAAVLLAFSSAAAWAGVSGDAAEQKAQSGAAAIPQPSGTEAAEESLGWQFVNGQGGATEQAAQDEAPAAAQGEEQGQDEQAAQSGEQAEPDSQAASGNESSPEQAATGQETEDGQQSARSGEQPESDSQAASGEEAAQGQTAAGEETADGQQSAQSAGRSEDQSAQSDESAQGDQAADSRLPAGLEGKVVVIIPKDWQGSLPDLVAALRMSPDAKDIVIVQQGEPQASNSAEDDDGYFADRTEPADEDDQDDD